MKKLTNYINEDANEIRITTTKYDDYVNLQNVDKDVMRFIALIVSHYIDDEHLADDILDQGDDEVFYAVKDDIKATCEYILGKI